MFSSTLIRIGVLAMLMTPAIFLNGRHIDPPLHPPADGVVAAPTALAPDSLSDNSTYYTIRRDVRRCASPMCGGFFVRRVNHNRTRCANGRMMAECYVAEIDWNGHPTREANTGLLRGNLLERRFPRLGRFGVFSVTESWQAAGSRRSLGDIYRVKDLGVRCITHPCLTHHEALLNTKFSRKIAGVELNGTGASEAALSQASERMTGAEGILVAGTHRRVTGPAGVAQTLRATQFYLRTDTPVATQPCMKTGCSSQVCSDREVVTTCEWRPQYACYRQARCERQSNGECGFTQTPELAACLRRN